jgi:hypothetical protein
VTSVGTSAATARWLVAAFLATPLPAAAGFFDDLPGRGYVQQDLQVDAVRRGAGIDRTVVATVRYLSVRLDPGRRDLAMDLWPVRSMLLVEYADGTRIVFERVDQAPAPSRPEDGAPVGRIGLVGNAVEMYRRDPWAGGGAPLPNACSGAYDLLVAGSRSLPVAREDLDAPTVRAGIARFLDATLSPGDRDAIDRSVPLLRRASQSQTLPLGPLDVLRTLFPGREFAGSPEGITFEPTRVTPLDPGGPGFRTLTNAPELLPGLPAY